MSSAPAASYSPARIALVTAGVLTGAVVAYAAYFDYRRRNDPVFRKKLLKQQRKVEKIGKEQAQAEAAVGRAQVVQALKRAITLINQEQVPQDVEGREQFFLEQLAMGEQLAARSPEFYVAAAIAFFKALKVYPAPQELIMILQKTQPAAVFDLVMELITLEMSTAGANKPAEPLLTEIDDAAPVAAAGTSTAPAASAVESSTAPAAAASQDATANKAASTSSDTTVGSSPSTGSFVVVDESKVEVKATSSASESVPELAADKSADPPEPVLDA
ncbi:mitochondrial import receptor subunit tom20 [Microbotryomycetes sp. JL201]|nr:mitochondrial import receptor subunit tom20 [Microbotryomycetes sp. JL201]